ncbi:MAG: type II secretion system F family protein [Caldilineaceae bacterium]
MNIGLAIVVFVMLSVLFAFMGIYRWMHQNSEINDRFLNLSGSTEPDKQRRRMVSHGLERRITRFSNMSRLERELLAADISLTIGEFVIMRMGIAVVGFVLGRLISGYLLGGLLLATVGWLIPGIYLGMQKNKRAKAFSEQLPDMLNLLVSSLRAGYGLLHACNVVKDEMPDPIAKEFSRVIRETSLGYSLDEALDHMVVRVNNEDFGLIVTAIHVQNEVGGSLAAVLQTISKTIRERIKLQGDVRVLTAQQRMSGWILSMLPFGLATILMLLNPDYVMELFQPGWIRIIPATAIILIIIGNVVMRQFMKIEV